MGMHAPLRPADRAIDLSQQSFERKGHASPGGPLWSPECDGSKTVDLSASSFELRCYCLGPSVVASPGTPGCYCGKGRSPRWPGTTAGTPGIWDEACKVTGPPRRSSHAHAAAGLCKGLGGQDASRTTERISGPAAHVRLATHALRAAALQAGAGGAWLRCEARLYRHVGHSAATVLMRHSTTCFVSHGVTSGEIYLLTGAVSVTCVFRPRPVDLDVTVRLRTQ